jgi:phage tail-like protein
MAEAAPTAPQPAPTPAQTGVLVDPQRAYNFKLEMKGGIAGQFTECSGLGVRIQPIRYRDGGNTQVVHMVPGRVEYQPITLRYGLTSSRDLWDWMMTAVKGNVDRQHVSIILVAPNGVDEVVRYDLVNAWISEWRGAPLDALSQEIAIETLTLVFDSLDRQ